MTSILKVDQVEGASGTTLKLQEQTIQIQDTSSNNMISASQGGAVVLSHSTSAKLSTTSDGIDINNGNITFATANKGIHLGVTTPTAANLLDDYEEGDWTPTWITSGGNLSPSGSVTPASTSGKYTKIGDVVTVQFVTGLFSVTGTSGSYQITNLPFTCHASQPAVGTVREYGQTGYLGFCYVNGSSTTAVVYQSPTGGQVNNPYFYGCITYRVN